MPGASFPPDDVLQGLPAIGSEPEMLLADSTVHLKLRDPASGWRWYVLEWDGASTFFGLIVGRVGAVAGQFGRSELEGLRRSDDSGLAWESDFEPRTVSELAVQEPGIAELLVEPAPREVNARGLVDLQ